MNLIDDFCKVVNDIVDVPPLYTKAAAYFIMSSTLGRFVDILETPTKMRPNTWFVLSSIPGRMRRSTITNVATTVMYNVNMEYSKLVNPEVKDRDQQKKLGKEMFKNSIIEKGTPEGMLDAIILGQENKCDCFNVISTEFGQTLKELTGKSKKTHTAGADVLMSKFYYGEMHVDNLSQRGDKPSRFLEAGYYVTLLCSMQEPSLYLGNDSSKVINRQGLMRRIKWLYMKPEELTMNDWKPPLRDIGAPQLFPEIKKFSVNTLFPNMVKYYNLTKKNDRRISSLMVPVVKRKINDEARKLDKAFITVDKDSEEMDQLIVKQTNWEYRVKLAVLNAMAEEMPKRNEEHMQQRFIIPITLNHLEAADKFLLECDRHLDEIINELTITSEDREKEYMYTKIVRFIHTRKKVSFRDIMQGCKKRGGICMTAEENVETLKTLLGQGRIEKIVDGSKEYYE